MFPAFSFLYEWADEEHRGYPLTVYKNWATDKPEMYPVTTEGIAVQEEILNPPEPEPEPFIKKESMSLDWFYNNQWVIGIVFVILGPLIAFFGTKWWFIAMPLLCAVFTMELICGVSLALGGMDEMIGTIVTLCLAVIPGVLFGCLLSRRQPIMLGILGFSCGFYSGVFLFAIICWCTGGKWNAVWGYYMIAVIFGIVGAIRGI